MDIRRVVLYAVLALIVFNLWNSWQHDFPQTQQTMTAQNHTLDTTPTTASTLLPNLPQASNSQEPEYTNATNEEPVLSAPSFVHVKTDVLDINIDLRQGDIVKAKLLNYPESVDDKQAFVLLQDNINGRYIAKSDLLIPANNGAENLKINFSSPQTNVQLNPGKEKVSVILTAQTANNLLIKKVYTFTRGSYLIDVHYVLNNQGTMSWKGFLNTQLLRNSPTEDKSSIFHVGSFTGASYSIPGQHRYKKLAFKDMAKENLQAESKGGWIAMQQHYFLSAWVANQTSQNLFYSRTAGSDYSIGSVSQTIVIEPASEKAIGSQLYVGPEDTTILKTIAPGLDLTVDYGWLWFLSSLLFSLMKAIYSVVKNWGWSIVLVTLLIKLAFYRLSAASYKSMAGMRQLQPKLQSLRERYGDDKAKLSQATMELYRQEKINPLGGCLPIVIQIPVFIALYWVLIESVELRQAPFILWINDLAAADPYHVLPIIMGITMLVQQRLNPAPPDPTQAKVMMFLPILFTALFWSFPAGLVLYWTVNNTLSILQQWHISNKYSDKTNKPTLVLK